MNMTIMTIDSRQLSFDIIPFIADKPWNIPRLTQKIDEKSKHVNYFPYISVWCNRVIMTRYVAKTSTGIT
jgi:hypothetical protein